LRGWRSGQVGVVRNEIPTIEVFFWNGSCLATSTVTILERTFDTVFEKAHVSDGSIHRFRDTFAVELLLKGVPIDRSTRCSGGCVA